MTITTVLLIWLCCILFNLLKLVQSYGTEYNFGAYIFAVFFGPIFTFFAFLRTFIFSKWT